MKEIIPEYTPVLWGAGEKKIKDHILQMDYIKTRYVPLRISEEFKLIQLPTYLKSSALRDYILDGNFKMFKESVPISIRSEFFNIKKELAQ